MFFQLDIIKKLQVFIWRCLLKRTYFFFSLQPVYKLILFWIIINCWRSVINLFVLQDRLHLTALRQSSRVDFPWHCLQKEFSMYEWYQAADETQLPHWNRLLCKPYFHKLPPAMKRWGFFLSRNFGSRTEFTAFVVPLCFLLCPQAVPARVLETFFSTSG